MLTILSTTVVDPEEERRGPGPSSVSLKDEDSTHTFNNRGKTAWNVTLIIHLVNTCVVVVCWTISPPLSPDKGQSLVIFGSEKDQ